MQLKNTKGVVIGNFTEEELKFIDGLVFDPVVNGETFAVVTAETLFVGSINDKISKLAEGMKAENAEPENIKLAEDEIKLYEKLIADLKLVPVYDGDNGIIDSVMPDDEGHIAYEPVKNAEGVVTHFVTIKPDLAVPETYPVYDYKEQKITNVTKEEAEANELLTAVYEDDKLVSYKKEPVYIFNVTATIGQVRISGVKDKDEAFAKLGEIELAEYINRDNTKLSFIE